VVRLNTAQVYIECSLSGQHEPDGKLERLTVSSSKHERVSPTVSDRNRPLTMAWFPSLRFRVCSPCVSLYAARSVARFESN
jgi:hypothetical protein